MGNEPVVAEVPGQEDSRHAAPAELALDRIAAGQAFLEHPQHIGHDGGGASGERI